jgi:hypothetical protein
VSSAIFFCWSLGAGGGTNFFGEKSLIGAGDFSL